MFLVGSKSELVEKRAVPSVFGHRKKEEIKQCVMFKEVSAFNDLDSIMELFNEIGVAIVHHGEKIG